MINAVVQMDPSGLFARIHPPLTGNLEPFPSFDGVVSPPMRIEIPTVVNLPTVYEKTSMGKLDEMLRVASGVGRHGCMG
jgi:hypothetical protein